MIGERTTQLKLGRNVPLSHNLCFKMGATCLRIPLSPMVSVEFPLDGWYWSKTKAEWKGQRMDSLQYHSAQIELVRRSRARIRAVGRSLTKSCCFSELISRKTVLV